ncbi:MAG: hypothetical protein QM813_14160 [Verrucomicrobiota bacterium]
MPTHTYNHNLRLGIAGVICVLLIATFSNFDTPTSKFNRFQSGIMSGLALVLLCPVVFRGKGWRTILGLALAVLPSIMLFRAIDYLLATHDR